MRLPHLFPRWYRQGRSSSSRHACARSSPGQAGHASRAYFARIQACSSHSAHPSGASGTDPSRIETRCCCLTARHAWRPPPPSPIKPVAPVAPTSPAAATAVVTPLAPLKPVAAFRPPRLKSIPRRALPSSRLLLQRKPRASRSSPTCLLPPARVGNFPGGKPATPVLQCCRRGAAGGAAVPLLRRTPQARHHHCQDRHDQGCHAAVKPAAPAGAAGAVPVPAMAFQEETSTTLDDRACGCSCGAHLGNGGRFGRQPMGMIGS